MGILEDVKNDIASRQSNNGGSTSKPERTPTQHWLNVGVNLPGAGKDGKDLFINLPLGIPLDDMKPVNVRGTNADFVHIQQAKNALLAATQAQAGKLAPGERCPMPEFTVEIARVSAPDQQGSVQDNPLLSGLLAALGGK